MKPLFLDKAGSGGSQKSLEVMRSYLGGDRIVLDHAWRPHDKRCWYTLPRFLLSDWWRELPRVREAEKGCDVLHCNHEGLIWYAIGSRLPVVCHVRTMWPRNGWGTMFRWLVLWLADAVICISENERRRAGLSVVTTIPNVAFEESCAKINTPDI